MTNTMKLAAVFRFDMNTKHTTHQTQITTKTKYTRTCILTICHNNTIIKHDQTTWLESQHL